MIRRRLRLVAPALAAALLLTGCTEPGGQGDSIVDDGVVQQWTDPDTAPVDFSGTTIDGDRLTSSSLRGHVVVVNFWYAGCLPCRREAPTLKSLAGDFAADGVKFVGVNTRDDRETAANFDRSFTPGYPSIVDQQDGASVQQAFASARGPNATPTTLVLDREGRVTARVTGLANESILKTYIQDAVDGKAA